MNADKRFLLIKKYKYGIIAGTSLFMLNLFDGLATFFALRNGAEELNPIGAWLIEHSGDHLLLSKTLMGLSVCIIISLWWDRYYIKLIFKILLVLYTVIAVYHILGLLFINELM